MEEKALKENNNLINLNLNQNFQNPLLNQTNRFEAYLDGLEGIVDNEPQNNKYEAIKFHKLNEYPYFLIGKVISKFEFDGQNQHLKGVGILVGPDVVLTVAHNLCHMKSSGNVYKAKQVYFEPAANGKFNLFEKVKFRNYFIPENYIKALNDNDEDGQLYNDWGLIFLSNPIGDYIKKYFDIKDCKYIEIINGLYSFFSKNEIMNNNLDLSSFLNQKYNSDSKNQNLNSDGRNNNDNNNYDNKKALKISIVGYSKNKINDLKNQYASKKLSTSAGNTGNNINLNNQGKNRANENNDDYELDKNININININTKEKRHVVTEGLFKTVANNKLIRNKHLENMGNGIDYILFNNEDLNRDFNEIDDENLIMTESKGTLKMDFSEIDSYLKKNFNDLVSIGNDACNNNNIKSKAPTQEFECAPHLATESNFSPKNEELIKNELLAAFGCIEDDLLQKKNDNGINSDNKNNDISKRDSNNSFTNSKIKNENPGRKISESLTGNGPKSLKYPISTYKGQSGSPIFLRIKKNDNNPKSKYIYVFIGLHSRRGPIKNDKLTELNNNISNINNNANNISNATNKLPENFFISETENATDSYPAHSNIKNYLSLKNDNLKNNVLNKIPSSEIQSGENALLSNLKPEEAEYKSLIMKNGICNYNVALNILGDTSKNIMDVINQNKESLNKERTSLNSEFVLVRLFDKENLALKGLFKNQLNMEVLFQVASDFKKLPIEFIRFKQCSDHFSKNYLTYNHDREKFLYKLIENEEESSELEFYININKNTYSKFIAESIFNKFSENYDIEKVKLDFKKFSKHLFDTIFIELKGYDPNSSFYGKFFKLIRDHLIKKIAIDNSN